MTVSSDDPGQATQEAIVAALKAELVDSSPNRATGIYDGVAPPGTPAPYVTFGDENTVPLNFLVAVKEDRFIQCGVWSTARGKHEIRAIFKGFYRALHNKRLPLSEGNMVVCQVERTRITRDADDVTFMGSVTLRVMTEH